MERIFNFSAGPAALPQEVLEQAREELVNWRGCGMSVMEMSHRGKEYMGIQAEAEADLRELMGIPANYKVLSIIARRGPITLSRLTEHFGVDKSLLSRAVRELESLEFIARTPDPEDRRSQLLTATAFGLERLDAARRSEENRLVGALSGWDVTDVERLAALLHALNSGDAPEPSER